MRRLATLALLLVVASIARAAEPPPPALARHLATSPRDAAGLGDAVGWRASGWPEWRLYQPIAEIALAAGLPVVAANLPATAARAVARGDLAALDPALVRRHALDRPAPAQTALEDEIRAAHW